MKRSRKVGVRTFFNARCDFSDHYVLGKKLGTLVLVYIYENKPVLMSGGQLEGGMRCCGVVRKRMRNTIVQLYDDRCTCLWQGLFCSSKTLY